VTWTNRQHDEALKKVKDGEKLSDHEERKLREASQQAGGRGTTANKAMQDYDKRRR
jgi:hypothetical protein